MLLSSTSKIMESGTCECLKEKKKDVALYICHTMWMIFNIWDEKWRHSAVYVYDYYHFIFLFPRDLHSQTKWIWTLFHNNFLSPPPPLPPMLLIAKWMFLCHLADQLWEGLGIRWSYKYVWECRCLKLQSFFWQIGTFIFLSIVSSLFGVMIIVAYGTYLSLIWIVAILFPLPVAIAGAIAVLGLIEFIVGLWAAIHSCLTFVDGTPFVGEAVSFEWQPFIN